MSLAAPLPANEEERLQALYELGLLDTSSDEHFDRIIRLVTYRFRVPIAAISLVDRNRQWFKSMRGLPLCETPRDEAFCAYTILQDDLLVVSDTLKDPRFVDHPAVIAEPFIRFYAGYPIKHPEGFNLGTLSLADHKPRQFSKQERRELYELGAYVDYEIGRYAHQQKAS